MATGEDNNIIIRDADSNRPRFKVDWTINPSHIVAFVGAIFAGLFFIWGIREDVHKTNASFERLVIELKAKNDLQDNEIKQIRDNNIVSRSEEIQFRGEVRTSITEITKILTDLRIAAGPPKR